MLQVSGTYKETIGELGVVAAANFDEQTGNLSFNLLDAPETGDYLLCDVLQIEVADASAAARLSYVVTWMGDNGVALGGYMGDVGIPSTHGPIPLCAISQGTILTDDTIPNVADLDGTNVMTPPTVLHAVKGTPISVSITLTGTATLRYSYHATLLRTQ